MLQSEKIASFREDYENNTLEINEVVTNPIEQFEVWFNKALNSNELMPNAMTLATATKEGIPSARIVLLKGVHHGQFTFYTNYNSKKSQELIDNPNAALVFNWLSMQRQIRIKGTVKKMDRKQSEAYFQSRPKGSQIGAWSSPQSKVIDDRSILENKKVALETEYQNTEILPCPPHWGGFLIEPNVIEFWQGRASRLHDRICYTKLGNDWKIERLAP
ncbi:MAG: pyridoxamine 5'-phosphate oxidase [Saprospiraceae bacterium]